MARYFFDVHDGKSLPDLEGTELPDFGVARAEAIRLAGEIIRELGAGADAVDWSMSVRGETGQVVLSVWFGAQAGPNRVERRNAIPDRTGPDSSDPGSAP